MANKQRGSFSKQKSQADVSKSPPSKNLAHVPCKFFKQGACQAGNSCPFSHQIDSSADTAPCKYFQKGNCKFGAKCALAHILPDGRRVNPKTLAQVYQNHNVVNGNGNGNGHAQVGDGAQQPHHQGVPMPVNGADSHNNGHGVNGKSNSTSPSSTVPVQIVNNSGAPDGNGNGFFSTRTMSISHSLSPTANNVPSALSPSSSFHNANLASTSPNYPGFASRVGSLHGSSGVMVSEPISMSPSHPRTYSTTENGASPFGNSSSIWGTSQTVDTAGSYHKGLYYRSVSHSSALRPNYQSIQASVMNESAIADDDDNDDMFEEDFVPSSLSDLLTPQELQRRGSRSSTSRPSTAGLVQLRHEVAWSVSQQVNREVEEESETQFMMDDDEFLGSQKGQTVESVGMSIQGLQI